MGAFSTAHCVEPCIRTTGHAQIALNDPSKRSPSAADLGIRSVLHFIHLDFVGNSHASTIQTTDFKDKSY